MLRFSQGIMAKCDNHDEQPFMKKNSNFPYEKV